MSSMCFSRCYTAHDRKIARLFGRYGRLIARHPWIFIICSIILNLLLGIGLLRLEFENDLETQYLPENNQASKDRDIVRSVFESSNHENYQIHSLADVGYFAEVIIRSKNGGNVFDANAHREVQKIHNLITKNVLIVDQSNKNSSYESLCAKSNNKCVIFGEELLSAEFIRNLQNKNVTYPVYKETVLLSAMLGKVVTDGDRLVSAGMLKLRYYLQKHPLEQGHLSERWVKEFVTFIQSTRTNYTELAYTYHSALDDEVTKSSMAEAHLFMITVGLMVVYASITTAGRRVDCVYDRQNLGRVGVFCAILSMVPAAGIASACGMKFMNSVGVMPFLIIGIGINDMFIIVSGHAQTIGQEMSLEERMDRTLRTSGLAITVTSLTDLLTFFIGYTSVFVTIQNFCIYTGLAVFFCYVNQLTILAPSIVIHQQKMDAAKHSVTCRSTKPRAQLRSEGFSACYVTCCSGEKPTSRADVESLLEIYPKRFVQFLARHNASRVVVFILYLGYIALSVWGVTSLKQGFRFSDLALESSDYYKASTWDFENFRWEIPLQIVFKDPVDYQNEEMRQQIFKFLNKLKMEPLIKDNLEINWLSTYITVVGNGTFGDKFTSLRHFLNETRIFKGDVIFSPGFTNINYSRFYLFSENLRTSDVQGQFLLRIRELEQSSRLPCFIYSPLFVFFEQYAIVVRSTLQTVGVAVAAMFLVACFFMPHPLIITFVSISLVSILLGVFGFLPFWGLNISSVTMIELIISVGFSVDFSAHLCHAYLTSQSRERKGRVQDALELAGGPVINGALSTIIGLVMLNFSESFIFQSFFKVLFMVIVFGLIHAVLILPTFLSVIGPKVRILSDTKPDPKIKSDVYNGVNQDVYNGANLPLVCEENI
ncbi:patched domain-containing protein 3-like [Saccostrea echinata]|uniref:patched domain-containing protein 3-like n=1 Tax=Saccostrea echinata TaxID=191078 RepID=UPI002A824A59|nr:patched domain-containing protein 3-like [Saccostrea echinata]